MLMEFYVIDLRHFYSKGSLIFLFRYYFLATLMIYFNQVNLYLLTLKNSLASDSNFIISHFLIFKCSILEFQKLVLI
jgi:hypothetical protein